MPHNPEVVFCQSSVVLSWLVQLLEFWATYMRLMMRLLRIMVCHQW